MVRDRRLRRGQGRASGVPWGAGLGQPIANGIANVQRGETHLRCTHGARCYRNRWPLETACQRLEASCHAAIHPLGYPQAAFLGCCLALVASHTLAVVLAAFRGVQGEERMERDISR